MEVSRAPDGRAREAPAWRAVKRWPGLRGEPKLAWRFLYEFAGGQFATIIITAADVGADQGTSDRGGRRALEALALAGLVEVLERSGGRWTIYLANPLDVARARRSRGSDGQGELFDSEQIAEEPTSPPMGRLHDTAADVAPHPPRRADFDLDFSARLNKDLDLDFSSDFSRSAHGAQAGAEVRSLRSPRERDGGSGAATAAGAIRLADVLVDRQARGEGPASPPSRRQELRSDSIEAYVRYLKLRVGEIGDEGKFESFAVKVARLVFDPALARRFDDETVSDVLLALDRKRRDGELHCAYAFFVRCIQRKLADKRLSFPS